MGTRSIIAYKDTGETDIFTLGTYVHWDGYPTHMGESWWHIAHHELYKDNLAGLVEYFIQGNLQGWSVIDHTRDITKKPISPEQNQEHYRSAGDFTTDEQYVAWHAAEPLVSFRARRWDIMQQFGHTTEREAAEDPRCNRLARWETDEGRTPADLEDTDCEWLYVFGLEDRTLTVFKLRYPRGTTHLGTFSLDGEEPDWKAIEDAAYPQDEE